MLMFTLQVGEQGLGAGGSVGGGRGGGGGMFTQLWKYYS